jgi:asparagine synthetase B (glutamine-hydrolysing)
VSGGEIRRATLRASVLQMRKTLIKQPVRLVGNSDSYLAFNGELYQRMNEDGQVQDVWQSDHADTQLVADLLQGVLETSDDDAKLLLEKLTSAVSMFVNAEFAFCLLTQETIYYGRDRLGRRSLLVANDYQQDGKVKWALSSVASPSTSHSWKEVEPGIVFAFNWNTGETLTMPFANVHIPRPSLSLELPPSLHVDHPAVIELERLLLESVRRRLTGPSAILFSGGLDSVVLAALALRIIGSSGEPLTLVNVSFVDEMSQASNSPVAADTQAAHASYQELLKLFPDNEIIFVHKQADWADISDKASHVEHLIFPKSSVMDANIATALWFAASVCDTVRILLTGLGADEQFGGYGRHRKAFERGKLRQELDLDMGRLWDRNLGRDDRVLSDTAKEARFPYLDPSVVEFTRSLPLECVCDFDLPPGQGDKRILRLVAQRLGLQLASVAVKRAIQFGSRMSHVADKKRFGSRRKATHEGSRRKATHEGIAPKT